MIAKAKSRDARHAVTSIKELKDYQPVRLTEYKMWLWSLILILSAIILALFFIIKYIYPLAILGPFVFFVGIAVILEWDDLKDCFEKFYRCNIFGYYLCYSKKDGQMQCEVVKSGNYFCYSEFEKTFVYVPLSGWFSRPFAFCGIKKLEMKIGKYRLDDDLSLETSSIYLPDGYGNQLGGFSFFWAFRLLEEIRSMTGGIGIRFSWPEFTVLQLECKTALTRSRDDLGERYQKLVILIKETIEQIDATRNFSKSKQARAIRLNLIKKTRGLILPEDAVTINMFREMEKKPELTKS